MLFYFTQNNSLARQLSQLVAATLPLYLGERPHMLLKCIIIYFTFFVVYIYKTSRNVKQTK